MRISDWSSDVCSSDLRGTGCGSGRAHPRPGAERLLLHAASPYADSPAHGSHQQPCHHPPAADRSGGVRLSGRRRTREWVEGRPFAFDDTIEHEAWNDSPAMRAVLIFDVWNPHLTEEEQGIVAEDRKSTRLNSSH